MRLIDADELKKNNRTALGNVVVTEKDIDNEPTVDAIPIDYIKEQIEMYDELSDIRDDRWGDIYHTFSQLLRGLIAHWRKDNGRFEKSHN